MWDPIAIKTFGEGVGAGAGGLATAIVAGIFGIPAIRSGLAELRKLVERMETALEKLSENLAGIDKRLTAVEVQNSLMLGLHHPESLPLVTEGAEQVITAREEATAAGHPFRRAGDKAPPPDPPQPEGRREGEANYGQ